MKFEGYFTRKEMVGRGWTIKMFTDHLPEPHKKIPNPYNADFSPIGLFDQKIVEEIEADPDFQHYKKWTVGFRARMKEVARESKARRG